MPPVVIPPPEADRDGDGEDESHDDGAGDDNLVDEGFWTGGEVAAQAVGGGGGGRVVVGQTLSALLGSAEEAVRYVVGAKLA